MNKEIKQKITGKILKESGKKWFVVSLDNYPRKNTNLMLKNSISKHLKVDDTFELYVSSTHKNNGDTITWYHIPISRSKEFVIGVGITDMKYQPITGNIIVHKRRALKIIDCKLRSGGYSRGYGCENWWKMICLDISNTDLGQKALREVKITKEDIYAQIN